MAPCKILIIVVNWNSGQMTSDAIKPYLNYESNIIKCQVVVVDNASLDDSLEILGNQPIDLIKNKKNLGFGHACNQAFEKSSPDYVLLLNPDTTSQPSVLEELTQFLEQNPRYAVAGPQQKDEKGNILRCCGRFPTFWTALWKITGLSKILPYIFTPSPIMLDWNHLESRDVDQIMGSYMLIRRTALDISGFMDTDYFVYGEDLDLSKRLTLAGFKSFFYSNVSIKHVGGASGHKDFSQRLYYSLSSQNIYWKKHFNISAYLLLTIVSICIEPFIRIITAPGNTALTLKAYYKYGMKLVSRR